jgi:hypothetical protein
VKSGGPLPRYTPLTSKTSLRPGSPRAGSGRPHTTSRPGKRRPASDRAVFDQATRDLIWARCGGLCEVCTGPLPAKGWAVQHRKARGMGGAHRTVTAADGIAVHNRPCHLDVIEANPAVALEMGWRITQQDDPETAPLWLPGGRRVLLTATGQYVDMP